MSERKVYDCDKCGVEIEDPQEFRAGHAGTTFRIDLCHRCTTEALSVLLEAHEQREAWNGTKFINTFGGFGEKLK